MSGGMRAIRSSGRVCSVGAAWRAYDLQLTTDLTEPRAPLDAMWVGAITARMPVPHVSASLPR